MPGEGSADSGIFFLGEAPGWWAVLGGAIIVGAVAARTFASERKGAKADTVFVAADI